MKRALRKDTKAGRVVVILDVTPVSRGKKVRVYIRKDGTSTLISKRERTDEGFDARYHDYTYRGGRIYCDVYEEWRDCDGPGSYVSAHVLGPKGWQPAGASRRYDAFAEAAGY